MSIIQSLWIGKSFSVMEKLCVSSFMKNGDEFHLYTYDDIENLPENVILHNADKIISSDKIFKYKKHNSYAGFANLFRYKLLLEKGNYWVDTDVISLKKFDHDDDYLFANARTPRRILFYGNTVCNCVMKAPKDSEIMQYCYDESRKKDSAEISWGETGPELLTKATKIYGLKKFVSPSSAFCPINWFEWEKIIKGHPKTSVLNDSFAIHLWNEMWRRSKINKSGEFPENSIYEKLKNKYL